METYEFESFRYPGTTERASQVLDLGNGTKRVIWLKDKGIPDSVDEIIVSCDASCHNCGDLRDGNLCAPFRSNNEAQSLGLAHPRIKRLGFLSAELVLIPTNGNPICPLYTSDSAIFPASLEIQGRGRVDIDTLYPNSRKILQGDDI